MFAQQRHLCLKLRESNIGPGKNSLHTTCADGKFRPVLYSMICRSPLRMLLFPCSGSFCIPMNKIKIHFNSLFIPKDRMNDTENSSSDDWWVLFSHPRCAVSRVSVLVSKLAIIKIRIPTRSYNHNSNAASKFSRVPLLEAIRPSYHTVFCLLLAVDSV